MHVDKCVLFKDYAALARKTKTGTLLSPITIKGIINKKN